MIRATALVLAFATPASATPVTCLPLPDMLVFLSEGYGEIPLFAGIDRSGLQVVTTMTPSGSTWTSLIVEPSSGDACIERYGFGGTAGPVPSDLM
jgi:ABC-type cobalt transport system substrate-binding protein